MPEPPPDNANGMFRVRPQADWRNCIERPIEVEVSHVSRPACQLRFDREKTVQEKFSSTALGRPPNVSRPEIGGRAIDLNRRSIVRSTAEEI
jgi:hypothetical protein